MLKKFLHHRAIRKRSLANEHVKNGAPQRVEIAAHIGRARITSLLRRNVVERAERHAADRELLIPSHLMHTSQPHIHQAGAAGGGHDDVRWLDVSVHNVAIAGVLQRVGNLDRDVDRAGYIKDTRLGDHVPQVRAFDKLKHDEVPAVL